MSRFPAVEGVGDPQCTVRCSRHDEANSRADLCRSVGVCLRYEVVAAWISLIMMKERVSCNGILARSVVEID